MNVCTPMRLAHQTSSEWLCFQTVRSLSEDLVHGKGESQGTEEPWKGDRDVPLSCIPALKLHISSPADPQHHLVISLTAEDFL